MYYVYVLQSLKTKEFYKGFTDDLERRLREHNGGKTTSTRKMLPLKLVYVHECADRNGAREWEKFFKSGIGREIIKELAAMLEWYTG